MPPSARSTTRRSPRPAPRPPRSDLPSGRPLLVPFAALFGLLVAVEDAYLAWLLSFAWYLVVPLVLAVAAVTGVVLVWWGRPRGWLVLAVAAVFPLLGLLALAVLFGLVGGGSALWSSLLLLAGPVGCLALTLRRPVRDWCSPGGATRSPGGRRPPGRSR